MNSMTQYLWFLCLKKKIFFCLFGFIVTIAAAQVIPLEQIEHVFDTDIVAGCNSDSLYCKLYRRVVPELHLGYGIDECKSYISPSVKKCYGEYTNSTMYKQIQDIIETFVKPAASLKTNPKEGLPNTKDVEKLMNNTELQKVLMALPSPKSNHSSNIMDASKLFSGGDPRQCYLNNESKCLTLHITALVCQSLCWFIECQDNWLTSSSSKACADALSKECLVSMSAISQACEQLTVNVSEGYQPHCHYHEQVACNGSAHYSGFIFILSFLSFSFFILY